MALTIYKQPQVLTPAYNSQVFTALSSNIAIADFKYVVKVTINGILYRKEYLQRPDGWLVVDVKEWVQNFIEHYFNPALSLAYPIEVATNKSITVLAEIGDYYSGADHFTYSYTYRAFDASLTDDDFRVYNYQDYIFNQTVGKLFLSKTTSTITPDNRLVLGQDLYLHFINPVANPITSLLIRLSRGGSIIASIPIASMPIAALYDIYAMRINSAMFTSVTPQVGDIITVRFINSGGVIAFIDVTIKDICTKYTDNVLYYLDRDGNIVFFHFDKISKNSFTKKTNNVTLNADRLNTTTGAYGSNTWDREDHTISTAIESTILLNTDWITEEQSQRLNDLWSSPQVWLWDGIKLMAVNSPSGAYEEYKSANESLVNYTVTLNTGTVETRQRGI
ncbi:MAG: hypothetical protein ACOVK2_05910 [Candidatus Fonsibacter sp.]